MPTKGSPARIALIACRVPIPPFCSPACECHHSPGAGCRAVEGRFLPVFRPGRPPDPAENGGDLAAGGSCRHCRLPYRRCRCRGAARRTGGAREVPRRGRGRRPPPPVSGARRERRRSTASRRHICLARQKPAPRPRTGHGKVRKPAAHPLVPLWTLPSFPAPPKNDENFMKYSPRI